MAHWIKAKNVKMTVERTPKDRIADGLEVAAWLGEDAIRRYLDGCVERGEIVGYRIDGANVEIHPHAPINLININQEFTVS
jgi:hypothetical protein